MFEESAQRGRLVVRLESSLFRIDVHVVFKFGDMVVFVIRILISPDGVDLWIVLMDMRLRILLSFGHA